MKGPFVLMLAGIPLYLRQKLYPRLNGAACTSHFPPDGVGHGVGWHKEVVLLL